MVPSSTWHHHIRRYHPPSYQQNNSQTFPAQQGRPTVPLSSSPATTSTGCRGSTAMSKPKNMKVVLENPNNPQGSMVFTSPYLVGPYQNRTTTYKSNTIPFSTSIITTWNQRILHEDNYTAVLMGIPWYKHALRTIRNTQHIWPGLPGHLKSQSQCHFLRRTTHEHRYVTTVPPTLPTMADKNLLRPP